jgi:7-cyano-7-deazaguanine synthase
MDSSTLLLHLLRKGYIVQCISIDYGQKHKIELERATELVKYLNQNNNFPNHIMDSFYPIHHKIIKIEGLSELLNSSLVEGGSEVPEGHYAEDNMKSTVVENRNKIFSSIVQSIALSIANQNNSECKIALGIHSGDHTVYLDTTEEFRQADLHAFKIGNWNSDKVDFYAPYMETDKFGILEDGLKCCEILGLDFDEVYKRTNTSYKPIQIKKQWIDHLQAYQTEWASDFKSASSVERVEAFLKLGRPDPVRYAEVLPNGEVIGRPWEEVVVYVKQILDEHKKKEVKHV